MPGLILQGAGLWGSRIARQLTSRRIPVALVTRSASSDRISYLAQTFPQCPVFPQVGAAINAGYGPEIIICTPAFAHAEHALAAIAFKMRILLEKPMATTARDAENIVAAAAAQGLPVLVGHTYLFSDIFACIARIAADDPITEIRSVCHRPVPPGRDVAWELSPHFVSVALKVFDGETPKITHCQHSQDCTELELTFRERGIAWVAVARSSRRLTTLRFTTASGRALCWHGNHLWAQNPGGGPQQLAREGEPLWNELRYFMDSDQYQRASPSDGALGAAVVRIIEEACESNVARGR
jgi:predicted dehydrogenase